MTRIEGWLKQPEYIKQALKEREPICIREKCINLEKGKPKENAFCEHFWQIYHRIAS